MDAGTVTPGKFPSDHLAELGFCRALAESPLPYKALGYPVKIFLTAQHARQGRWWAEQRARVNFLEILSFGT